MIARYSRPEMAQIWDERRRYQKWLMVELAVCEGLAREGRIPRKDWRELKAQVEKVLKKGGVDPKRVETHEAVVRHDVIAFTTALAEVVGPVSRYVHFGLTSSDVIDTAFALTLQEAGALLLQDIDLLLKALKRQALAYRSLPTIGRSHGIFAEPTSFGLKFLSWYCEWERNRARLEQALAGVRVGKLSGAVGVNPHWDVPFETRVLSRLGLGREKVSTQVVPRDRHAEFLGAFALCAASLERIAVELRHLQRSEVAEILESFVKGQKGSSAMPHKRNPISSENITGLARLIRAYAQSAIENVPLWHERDISHSSVERVAFPDAAIALDYALNRMRGVIENLVVRRENVQANLEKAGKTVFSGHYLLELVQAGATREEAYRWVQQCALDSLEGRGDFIRLLEAHPEVSRYLSAKRIRELGSLKYQLRHVGEIYRSVLAPPSRKRR